MNTPIPLRDYQQAAVNDLRAHVAAGRRRLLLQSATGSGKRPIAAAAPAAPAGPRLSRPLLVEWELPWRSRDAAAIALAGFRSLTRAPEAKMMLLTPFIMAVIFGGLDVASLRQGRRRLPAAGGVRGDLADPAQHDPAGRQSVRLRPRRLPRLRPVSGAAARHPARQEPVDCPSGAGAERGDASVAPALRADALAPPARRPAADALDVSAVLPVGEPAVDARPDAHRRRGAQAGQPQDGAHPVAVPLRLPVPAGPGRDAGAVRRRGAGAGSGLSRRRAHRLLAVAGALYGRRRLLPRRRDLGGAILQSREQTILDIVTTKTE